MLRHILVLTALTVGSLQGMGYAASLPIGNEGGGPLKLEQRHYGQDPSSPADIGNTSIQALASGTGGVIYAGSFGMGIFRSSDRGGTWMSANEGLTDPFVLCLTTGKDGAIFAGTFRGGVFRSRDAGKTWQPINKGLKRLEIKALMMDAKGLYAGTGDGVYLLNAAQEQWKVVTTGLDEILVHALARTDDGTLYAGTSGKGVHSYKERTPGWTRLRQGLKDHEGLVENFIRVLAVDKEQGVYAGTFDGGVFRSGDGLQGVNTATSLRVRGGKVETMDGPFAETREHLGGYYLLDVPDLDAALRYAALIPVATYGTIEVRPVMDYGPAAG